MSALRTASGLLAAFLLLAASARAEDAAGRAFVEQELQPTDVLVGERVEYVLRVGLESSWRTWLVPEIDRPLDLPVRVASAAIKPAGARPVDEGEQGDASFVLDGHVVRGVREVVTRQGRRYDTITLRREWRVSEAGTTLFRAPRVTIRAGRDWSESLLGTRVPGEVVEYDVAGETARLVVRDPPEEGRPRGWVDAVGRFGVDASLEALRPVDQRVLRVTLRITGSGNLATLTPPGKAALAGFHVLGTLDMPSHGQVRFEGRDLTALSAKGLAEFRNRSLGFMFQFHHLLPEFNALENIMLPGLIQGRSRKEMEKRARSLLEEVGLLDRATHRPGELSGGE